MDNHHLHHHPLFRTSTQNTATTSSSASSARTVRPSSAQMTSSMGYMDPNDMNDTVSVRHFDEYTSYSPTFPPVPPARTSSLHLPRGGGSSFDPNVRLSHHETPTRMIKPRRIRITGGDDAAMERSMTTMTKTTTGAGHVGSRRRNSKLELTIEQEGQEGFQGKFAARGRDEMEEDEDSEEDDEEDDEEDRVTESKKMRARELGKMRQRRKRAKDKLKREAAKASGDHPPATTSLTTDTQLAIPARTSSANQPPVDTSHSLPLNVSLPSSASSSYSPLPGSHQNYYNLSPNTSFSSACISGQSSPGTFFSPAMSTPSMQYSDGTLAIRNDPSTSSSTMDVGTKREASRRGRLTGRSLGQPGHFDPTMVVDPILISRPSGPNPAKRRKSEPEPEEFRSAKGQEVGLGVIIDPKLKSVGHNKSDRPNFRRTASDGMALLGTHDRSPSITPPPVVCGSLTRFPKFTAVPSDAGNFFASTMVSALTNSELMSSLTGIGVGMSDVEELKGDLAGVFDKWRMEKGMRTFGLGTVGDANGYSTGTATSEQGDETMINAPVSATSETFPNSPIRQVGGSSSASLFTPGSTRVARETLQPHSTIIPLFTPQSSSHSSTQSQSVQDSPLAVQTPGLHQSRSLSLIGHSSANYIITPSPSIHWPNGMTVGKQSLSESASGDPQMTPNFVFPPSSTQPSAQPTQTTRKKTTMDTEIVVEHNGTLKSPMITIPTSTSKTMQQSPNSSSISSTRTNQGNQGNQGNQINPVNQQATLSQSSTFVAHPLPPAFAQSANPSMTFNSPLHLRNTHLHGQSLQFTPPAPIPIQGHTIAPDGTYGVPLFYNPAFQQQTTGQGGLGMSNEEQGMMGYGYSVQGQHAYHHPDQTHQ